MDASRFKRRELKHTERQVIRDATGGMVSDFSAPVSSTRPRPSAPPMPTQARKIIINEFAAQPQPALAPRPRPAGSAQHASPLRQQFVDQPAPAKPAAPVRPEQAAPRPASRIDMGLPGGESEVQTTMKLKKGKWRTLRPYLMRTAAVMTVLVLAAGGFFFSQGYFKIKKVFKGGTATAAALTANVDPHLLKGEGDGRVNILLLGRGGGTHDAPDLTDTMMIASVDPVNHNATLLSIPRDLWVDVPNFGAMKINAVWESGKYKYSGKIDHNMSNTQGNQAGFDLIDQEIENVTAIPIHYNLLVDFTAFQKAVDTVGGVTINVPENLIDPTMAWENGNNPVLAKAGVQQFDGKHALIYVRSRETTSDFARAERQRSVLLALKQKVETVGVLSNPIKIAGLMNSFADNAQSDLSLNDATRLVQIMKGISPSSVNSIALTSTPGYTGPQLVTTGAMNGQSIVEPKAGLFVYSDIQNFIRSELKDGYITKENAKILVLNGSTVPGLAATKSDELKTYGYNVVGAANAPTKGYTATQVVDLTGGKDKYTKNYLEQRFSTTAVTTLPDPAIQANGADFVIILGSDASTSH